MEVINYDFNQLLEKKWNEVLTAQKEKLTFAAAIADVQQLNYAAKTTLYKINAEQTRKHNSSKKSKKDYSEYMV